MFIPAPHWPQNMTPARLLAPQAGQVTVSGTPQLEQKVAPFVDSVSHFGHRISAPCSADKIINLNILYILT